MQANLRRYRDNLRSTGMGVIAFGIWTAIKLLLSYFLMPEYWSDLRTMAESNRGLMVVTIVVISSIIAVDMGIRILIGRSAIAESADGKKRNLYIVVTIVMMLISLFSIVILLFLSGETSNIEKAASLIFEASSFGVMLWLLISVFKARAIMKEQA